MIIRRVELSNFLIFSGDHSFNLSDKINLVVGKNESGKSVLSIDAFKYVLFKKIRYKKINNVLNKNLNGSGFGSVSISMSFDDLNMAFKRYVLHPEYKNNLLVSVLDDKLNPINSSEPQIIISDIENITNLKNVPSEKIMKMFNVDLDFFELVSIYNPTKSILNEKQKILDMLTVSFPNVTSLFDTIYKSFDSELSSIQNEIAQLENKLSVLVKRISMQVDTEEVKKSIITMQENCESLELKKKEITKAKSKLDGMKGSLTTVISEKESENNKLTKFINTGVCYTCNRKFEGDMDGIKGLLSKNKNDVSINYDKLKDIKGRIIKARETIESIDDSINKLMDKIKTCIALVSTNEAQVDQLREMVESKRKQLDGIENRYIIFKKSYDKIFSVDMINDYVRNKIVSFENIYKEVYNLITNEYHDVSLNLNKYEEPEFGDYLYSGLSTSKKRIVCLSMMLALHIFCDIKVRFLVLDEFFDVFDFDRMVKVLEAIFSNNYFNNLQFIITSNNDDLISLIQRRNDTQINLISLLDNR